MRLWHWLNERVVEVPEHYYDWMAPRWYLGIVALAYIFLAWCFWQGIKVMIG